ncbi:proline-specific peptidase [Mycena floridula]|nr:proline-specific peptidase [Mycena floridula]
MTATEGSLVWSFGTDTFETWYTVVGDMKSSTQTPLVVLHGGPGLSHHYMLSHLELYASHGIPVILYDQVGIGRSTHPKEKPDSFWNAQLFMDELEAVLKHFDIGRAFSIIGHSWGGMLGAHFAAERKPPGLKRLLLISAPASMSLFVESTNLLFNRLPEDLREMLKKHESEGTTDSAEYQEGMQIFYAKHICKLDPWPSNLTASFAAMGEDPTVYGTMIGASEFNCTGTLKPWTIVDILHQISVPTLITNGRDDEIQDICVVPFFKRIPKVKWVSFAESHLPFFEEPERYMKTISDFLSGNAE